MTIGIITHHFASNFGAQIQTLSTVGYLKKAGHNPIVLNWQDKSLISSFSNVPPDQMQMHNSFLKKYIPITEECFSEDEIIESINKYDIQAVIIGSDAVVQHHPYLSRIAFPTRKIISIRKFSKDRLFPNQFWGLWCSKLNNKIPLAFMSVSSQNSPYSFIRGNTRKKMKKAIDAFNYLSVRDEWTKRMFYHILGDKTKHIPVTPDPVFAFNLNAGELVKSEVEIRKQFNLADKYILMCFFHNDQIPYRWITDFVNLAREKGYTCYSLPVPAKEYKHSSLEYIGLPLDPLDWYALIKYSSGFIGRNMHPIIVSLHNMVPCFSFDQYGTKILNLFINESSSKIYHILDKADLLSNRTTYSGVNLHNVEPLYVLDKILNYDRTKYKLFSDNQIKEYEIMMRTILDKFVNN